MEHRLGRPFDDIVRTNVLEPLGMTDTTFDPTSTLADRMAPVTVDLPSLAGVDGRALVGGYTRLRLAGGGLWSTASDVLRFGGRSCGAASSTGSGSCRRRSWS